MNTFKAFLRTRFDNIRVIFNIATDFKAIIAITIVIAYVSTSATLIRASFQASVTIRPTNKQHTLKERSREAGKKILARTAKLFEFIKNIQSIQSYSKYCMKKTTIKREKTMIKSDNPANWHTPILKLTSL